MNVLISHAQDETDLAGAWKDLLTTVSDGAIEVWCSSDLDNPGMLLRFKAAVDNFKPEISR